MSTVSPVEPCVLFVDDEPSLTRVASALLAHHGFRVHAATCPREALSAFAARPDAFDAMVTDLSMPGMTGLELASFVRSLRPRLPIVLCSGTLTPAHRDAARSLGLAGVLEKPYSGQRLAELLRAAAGI